MKTIAIIYGSSTGNTQEVAKKLQKALGDNASEIFDISSVSKDIFTKFDNFILGTSTWGLGDLQDDWDSFLTKNKQLDFTGKTFALYGLGDSSSYSDTFVDGMSKLYDYVLNNNGEIIARVQTTTYDFDSSCSVVDNMFVGLPIDEDNQSKLTDERINVWVKDLVANFK